MKRLFEIRDLSTGKTLPDAYLTKWEAKVKRNALQGPRAENDPWRYVVTRGPDHNHWSAEGGTRNNDREA